MSGFPEILQQSGKRFICQRKIFHLGILVHGKTAAFQIETGFRHAYRKRRRRTTYRGTNPDHPSAVVQLPANPPRGTLVPEQQIHHSAQQRKRTDKQHPENFIRGISGLVDDIQFNRQTQSDKCNIDPRCILCQPQKQDHKPHQLQDNQESDNYHSAGQHADQFFQLSPHNITLLSGIASGNTAQALCGVAFISFSIADFSKKGKPHFWRKSRAVC